MSHTVRNRLGAARPNKLVSLNEAIATIRDGDVLFLGSLLIIGGRWLRPMR